MHVGVIIGGGVPNPVSGGGALTTYTVVRRLLDVGHRVTVFVLHDPVYYDPAGAGMDARTEHLRELGADVVPLPSGAAAAVDGAPRDLRTRVRRAVSPSIEQLHPHLVDTDVLAAAVAEAGCDVAFVYHFEALAASRALTVPRVAGVGDPPQLPVYYRWRDGLPRPAALRQTLRVQAVLRAQPRYVARLLDECAAYGAFAAHHAAWLRTHGAPRCEYFRTPVPDPGAAAPRSRRDEDGPFRILLLGHLGGIVTIDGLRVFARALPMLERELGPEGVVVDVVGGYEPPSDLAELFRHRAVVRHGHSEDADSWLRGTDVLAVPTSIPLGVRVRIVAAFAAGTAVVAHVANAQGTPELEDGVNALVCDSPASLAATIARLARDPALGARLREGARRTYEASFRPEVAAQVVVDRLESVARPAAVDPR